MHEKWWQKKKKKIAMVWQSKIFRCQAYSLNASISDYETLHSRSTLQLIKSQKKDITHKIPKLYSGDQESN